MTGIFVRVIRNNKITNIEFDELTKEEMQDFAKSQRPESGWDWAISLALWIKENVKCERVE